MRIREAFHRWLYNAAAPADAATVRAWVNYTNSSGGVFKMPLYQ